MLSKQVADRESSSRAVGAAFGTHGEAAAAAVVALLGQVGEGAAHDVAGLVKSVGRLLAQRTSAMTAADIAHTRELGDDAPKRAARDQAAASVLSLVTSIRLALTGRFGQDFGGRLGLVGAAPETAGEVLSWGRQIHAALQAADLPPVDTADEDNDEVATFSKDEAVAKLGRRLAALEAALAATAAEVREAEVTQRAKDQAIAAYDEAFRFAAGLLEVLLRVSGHADLADRVRPSTRRPGQTMDAAAGGAPANPSSPAPDPSAPSGA